MIQTAFNFDAKQIAAEVQAAFDREALQRSRAGATYLGAKAICERLRFESGVHSGGAFKLNNNDTRQLAVNAEQRYPELRGKFRHRSR